MNIASIQTLIDSAYSKTEYPTCCYQMEKWSRTLPLKGLRVLDATPVFRNTLVKHKALLAAGAELYVGISDVMPRDHSIIDLLQKSGIPIVHPHDKVEKIDLVLDCAAAFCEWNPAIGFVELTRSGTEKYRKVNKPVFIADNGRIKRIETCLGTGESYFRAMKQLGYKDWKGRRIIVFGSGKVGTGIIMYASKMGAEVVVVTDPATVTDPVQHWSTKIIDYKNSQAVTEAVQTAYAVVTATGVAHALEGHCSPETFIHSPALLANMGVEDEYGFSIPKDRVLMQKKTLNFILDEPTHLKYIDATMALHNEGALFLISHPEATGLIEPPTELEKELLDVCRTNGCIGDELDLI